MSNIARMMQRATAGAGGASLDVDEVFSTYLVTGTGSAYSVNNGIDLSGEGGLVWIKGRSSNGYNHTLYDTERSGTLFSDATNAASDYASEIASYNNNGFTTVSSGAAYNNVSGTDYVSWTFRKAPKFFDVVTYTGNGSSPRTINHNLNATVGMLVVKCTSNTQYWHVLHRSQNASKVLYLNTSDAEYNDVNAWGSTHATSTQFTVGSALNISGREYVVYLFAHNDGDGGFGPDSDQDIIKCGSISGANGRAELGFEPQWVLLKSSNYNGTNWIILDVMRGFVSKYGDNADTHLWANLTNAEANYEGPHFDATGFNFGQSGDNYIYMAIRRGPLAEPTSASNVFAVDLSTSSGSGVNTHDLGFVPDMNINGRTTGSTKYIMTRLMGSPDTSAKYLRTDENFAEANINGVEWFDGPTGTIDLDTAWWVSTANNISWTWKRAPGFFDVVTWDSESVTTLNTVKHNLGIKPDLVILKYRKLVDNWYVYNSQTTGYLNLDTNGATVGSTDYMASTTATDLNVTGLVSNPTNDPMALLFGSVSGVSKVGSYTGDGTTGRVIDCGFSNGASFVLIKGTSASGYNWCVWDSTRGIVSGNDPKLTLDTTDAQQTGYDFIDPHSSGFSVTNQPDVNNNGVTYIFYAIAA